MEVDDAVAKDIKTAVDTLYGTAHGQLLIDFLEERAGYHAPTYDPTSQSSITLAAGRTEMMMFLRNLNRLTEEQIVALCQEGQ